MATDVSSEFDTWIREKNIQFSGVRAAKIPGKGVGCVADGYIEPGDTLIHVPSTAILTVSPSDCFSRNISVHHALAQTLVDRAKEFKPWLDVMPSYEDLEGCMPVLWTEELAQRLPCAARAYLAKQRTKLDRDTQEFMKLPTRRNAETTAPRSEQALKEYKRAWLLVNTRSFYWDYPTSASTSGAGVTGKRDGNGEKPRRKNARTKSGRNGKMKTLERDDCMALCPFIDFFNHEEGAGGDSGAGREIKAAVSFNHMGFVVTANRHYEKGEEIHVTYGSYSNDFLLVEYGFLPPNNPADSIALDEYFSSYMNTDREELLRELDMLGNYTIYTSQPNSTDSKDSSTSPLPCHRTQTALRALLSDVQVPREHIRTYAQTGEDHPDADPEIERRVRRLLGDVLVETLVKEGEMVLKDIGEGKDGPEGLLVQRWREVVGMGRACADGWCREKTGRGRSEE
ncbi:MAG: hypothetical protein M1831_006679 [Alyxoria varia]|nr:MAG: hypothetical protein M1831_006679 [Alyxoria varia]